MKIDMSPKAIENRLKLVGELTRVCLLLGQNKLKNAKKENKSFSKPKSVSAKSNEANFKK